MPTLDDAGPLAPAWLESITPRLPKLERTISARIRGEIPEYRTDRGGHIAAEVRAAVRHSLRVFLHGPAGVAIPPVDADMFRRLGRLELDAGRRTDAMQTAFQIATDAVVQEIVRWARAEQVPVDVVAGLTSTVSRFIGQLARLAAEGYQQDEAARTGRDGSSRLVRTLIRGGGATLSQIRAQATGLGWVVPEQCAVAQATTARPEGPGLDAVAAELFDGPVLAGVVDGLHLLVVSVVPTVAALRWRLAWSAPGLTVFLGPTLPLSQADASYRLARRAATSPLAQTVRDGGVLQCADHLLALGSDPDVLAVLLRRRLGPLLELAATKRLQLGTLLSAWLELGSLKGDAPGVLDAPRQTLSYRTHRLQTLFGDQLQDRDARLELMLALRWVLPSWQAEADRAQS